MHLVTPNTIKHFRYKTQCLNEWPLEMSSRLNPLDTGGKYGIKNLPSTPLYVDESETKDHYELKKWNVHLMSNTSNIRAINANEEPMLDHI